MPAVRNVLVVGAGIAGTTVAAFLADRGVDVDLVEQKAEVTATGSGITLQGNALRVFRELGVWPAVEMEGYGFDTLGLRAPDAHGTLLVEMPDHRMGGPDLPATVGMPRALLTRILVARAEKAGANLRWGTAVTGIEDAGESVTAAFSDGTTGVYDLVIAADGLHSRVRSMIGIDVVPKPTGMAIWRVFTPRPASVTRTDLIYGGPSYIAGYCPTGEDSLYAYIVDAVDPADNVLSPAEHVERMRRLSDAYHGPWDEIRPFITEDRGVNYTIFETHVIDGRWDRGRVVLIGDAAHSCPPTLAQGAAQSLEDASVLAELLLAADSIDDRLFAAFTERRLERATLVVDSSVQLGEWLLAHQTDADVPGLMNRVATRVSEAA